MMFVNKFTRLIVIIASTLLTLQLPASGKKVGDFYCNSTKGTSPISKADIRSTATGFSIAVKSEAFSQNSMIFEISKNLEIQKYGVRGNMSHWKEISSRKPHFEIKKDGKFYIDFFANGCGSSLISGEAKFIDNAKSKIFGR